MFFIGIDPHKASHNAAVLDCHEQLVSEVRVRADRSQRDRLLGLRRELRTAVLGDRGCHRHWRVVGPEARRRGRACAGRAAGALRGCGSSTTRAATRPTRTMPAPRSWRCGTRSCVSFHSRITRRCCGSSRSVTMTWSRIAPARSGPPPHHVVSPRRGWLSRNLSATRAAAEVRRIKVGFRRFKCGRW